MPDNELSINVHLCGEGDLLTNIQELMQYFNESLKIINNIPKWYLTRFFLFLAFRLLINAFFKREVT